MAVWWRFVCINVRQQTEVHFPEYLAAINHSFTGQTLHAQSGYGMPERKWRIIVQTCSYTKRLESFWILNPFEIFCPVKSTIGTDWRLEKTNTLELTDEIVRESIRNEKMASYQFSFSRHRARISISFSARTLPSSELPISWNNDSPILNETRVVKFEKKVLL